MSSVRVASERLDRLDRRFYGFALPGLAAWIVFQVILPPFFANTGPPGSYALGILALVPLCATYSVCLIFSSYVLVFPIRARIKATVVLINLSHPVFFAVSLIT